MPYLWEIYVENLSKIFEIFMEVSQNDAGFLGIFSFDSNFR
jgi:hypothetical protein